MDEFRYGWNSMRMTSARKGLSNEGQKGFDPIRLEGGAKLPMNLEEPVPMMAKVYVYRCRPGPS